MPPMINTEIEIEKGLLEKMEAAFKAGLFKVCFLLTKSSESPLWKAILLHIIEIIQLLSFPLASTV
jgi:hypothetical protein